jgi:hypothetical protein
MLKRNEKTAIHSIYACIIKQTILKYYYNDKFMRVDMNNEVNTREEMKYPSYMKDYIRDNEYTNEDVNNDEIIVIKKSWQGHLLVAMLILLFAYNIDHFGFQVMFSLFAIDQLLRIKSKIVVNYTKKEATFINYLSIHTVKNINSIGLTREPLLLFANSVGVAGLNDGISMTFVNITPEVYNFIRKF